MAVNVSKVAVLYGGDSAEREVSLNSGKAVIAALDGQVNEVIAFDTKQRALSELEQLDVDAVVIMLHGRGGEDGSLQGALEFMGIPYTGSGVLGSALAMDKIRSKQIFTSLGLPTAKFISVSRDELNEVESDWVVAKFNGGLMVKPSLEGSSIGMTKVDAPEQLLNALKEAFEFDSKVLLEQYIEGNEYTVAILGDEVLPSIRMRTPRSFYDYNAKYKADSTEYFCPSGLSTEKEAELAGLAKQAFDAVGASGWGRVDFMQDSEGKFYILEVNTVPGMTEKSLVPMAAKASGLSFAELVMAIVNTSDCDRV